MSALKSPVHIPPPRRAERTLLPAALAALLALLLVVQLAVPSPVELPDAAVARPLRLLPLPLPALLASPIIGLRPLFAPGRRENSTPGTSAVADKAVALEGARAVGIIRVRGAARVFLQAPDGTVIPVNLGGRYKGWRLVRTDTRSVVVTRGAERATLTVSASAPPVAPRAENSEEEEQQ